MPRGGKRIGAGRKEPASPYGEPTSLIRIPNSIKSTVITYLEDFKSKRLNLPTKPLDNFLLPADDPALLELPVYSGKVSAGRTTGFASPADDYEQEKLDINQRLVRNKAATVFMWVGKDDDSMIDVGIMPGALLVVDKSVTVRSGKIVVTIVDDEYVVKRFYKYMDVIELRSMNQIKNYPPITFKDGAVVVIEGVVTNVVTSL
jgi:DNA polymerase V